MTDPAEKSTTTRRPRAVIDALRGRTSVNARIARALFTVATLGMIGKGVALLKDLVVAREFGVGAELDAFVIAFLLPTYAITIIVSSFRSALLPIYVEVREREGPAAAGPLVQHVAGLSAAIVLVVMGLMVFAAPLLLDLVGSGMEGEAEELTQRLFYILLPTMLLSSFGTIWTAVLNADERNVWVGAAPLALPFVPLVILVVAGRGVSVELLAVATLLGYLLEAALAGGALRHRGLRLLPRWDGMHPALRRVLGQYLPMTIGATLIGSAVLIDQAMASSLGTGSVAALSYAAKGPTMLVSVIELGLGTAVLPQFARMAAMEDWAGMRATLRTWLRLLVLVAVPVTLLLMALTPLMVRLLFERGQFTADDTHLVSELQILFLIFVPPYCVMILMVRMIAALKQSRYLAVFAGVNLVLNIVGNVVFRHFWGLHGIVASTVFVYAVAALYVGIVAHRLLGKYERGELRAVAGSVPAVMTSDPVAM